MTALHKKAFISTKACNMEYEKPSSDTKLHMEFSRTDAMLMNY
jgi:hypothetical protein